MTVDSKRGPMFTLKLANRLSEVGRRADGVERWCAESGLAELAPRLNVVFDDAVSNSINYGFDDQAEHEIEVRMTLSERRLRLEVIDDGIAFDPLRNEDPDVELDIDERKIGGPIGRASGRESVGQYV